MYRISGSVEIPKGLSNAVDASTGLYAGVSYAAQLPWLEHASIKENILFGSTFEAGRYEAVLDACALRPDLLMFEEGDECRIGENGISLSGGELHYLVLFLFSYPVTFSSPGQKARVALARAVYSRANVSLLSRSKSLY